MDIGVVRSRTGLSASTLHHYEQVGLIESTGRAGLRRQYDDDVIDLLAVVALCQRSGFTQEEIRALMVGRKDSVWKASARAKLVEIDESIAMLESARDGLRHALECPSRDIMRCAHFRASLDAVYPER